MAAAVGDIFQLTVRGSYLGVATYNVFHYKLISTGTTPSVSVPHELVDQFDEQVVPKWMALLTEEWISNQQRCIGLREGTEYLDAAGFVGGLATTDPDENEPTFVTLTYRYLRTSVLQRYGYKRFSGIHQQDIAGNTIDVGAVDASDELAAELQATLTSDANWIFRPFVASRPINLGSNPSGYEVFNVVFNGVGTQNSRKQ